MIHIHAWILVESFAYAGQQPMRNSKKQREMHQRSTQKTKINKQERKANTIFNGSVICLRPRGKRDLIDSTINYKFLRITIHEGSIPLFIDRES